MGEKERRGGQEWGEGGGLPKPSCPMFMTASHRSVRKRLGLEGGCEETRGEDEEQEEEKDEGGARKSTRLAHRVSSSNTK